MHYPVLIPKKLHFPFTYNAGKISNLKIGDIVIVPFGKSEEIGVIWDKKQVTTKNIKIKNIKKKLNYSLSKNLISFINQFSTYNISPRGLTLKLCLSNKNIFLKDEILDYKKNNIQDLKLKLNKEQKDAIEHLNKSKDKFCVNVLQGVTGSGKTIVYFESIKKIINEKNQVLILLPEIYLTRQIEDRFYNFFGFKPDVWHSKINPKKRRKIWQGVSKNKIRVVLGARSSLFLPFQKLKLIIVDEEHDTSYKQEDGLIYNARDMAILRSSIEKIPINLVTSVPSIETFNNIQNKKYKFIQLKKRFNNFPFASTKIVDLNLKKQKNNYIADETHESIQKYIQKGDQVLFFLNKRGHSLMLVCKNCGFKFLCDNCSIYLTYHKNINKLVCHYCGVKKEVKNYCKKTNSPCDFYKFGPGVEKIYDELKEKYPNKNIKIFSSDYLKKVKEGQKILKEIEDNKIDIIVGTQMISKGYNFSKLNCIVVIDADFSGKGYDLRSTEKNIQLFNQLSGRAGRFSKDSLIVYQTLLPSNFSIQKTLINKPDEFLLNELKIRKENNLPPFKRLIAIIISSKSKENSFRGAQELKLELLKNIDTEVLGPVESPMSRIKKYYRSRILLKTNNNKLIQKNIAITLQKLTISTKIKLTVDVDPINFS